MTASLRHQYARARTGIRSGIAPSDVWHLSAGGGPVCGARRYRASTRVDAENSLAAAVRQVESQGGTVCLRCLAKIRGGV